MKIFKQTRCLSFLNEFEIKIKHEKGKENKILEVLRGNVGQNLNNIGVIHTLIVKDRYKKK